KQHAVTIGPSVGRRPRAWSPARAIALGYQFLEQTILSQPNMLQQLSRLLSGTRTIQIPRHVLSVTNSSSTSLNRFSPAQRLSLAAPLKELAPDRRHLNEVFRFLLGWCTSRNLMS